MEDRDRIRQRIERRNSVQQPKIVEEVVETITQNTHIQPRITADKTDRNVLSAKEILKPILVKTLDFTEMVKITKEELFSSILEVVKEIIAEKQIILNLNEINQLGQLLLDDFLGLGPLEPLLADETVNDIMVNGPNQVYVERNGKLELTNIKFKDNDHIKNIAMRIATKVGRRVDESSPMVDARLMDGSRVNIIFPPLALDSPMISIRKFSKNSITLNQMVKNGNISQEMAELLIVAVKCRQNILISGGTGSGKTTLLNALSNYIDEHERIITIEDAAELKLQQPHVGRLETRPANLEGEGEITARDLVRNALRMRPDRIILGEIRGDESIDMLQAMNTGHDGSLGTIHANNPRDMLVRIENMLELSGLRATSRSLRRMITSINIVVQISRMRDGKRRITHISEITGMEEDVITMQDLAIYKINGGIIDGSVDGRFELTGARPKMTDIAEYYDMADRLMKIRR